MAQIFPKWTLKVPAIAAVVVMFLGANAVGFIWYYGSPKYTDVGYRPVQPVEYSHKLHAGDLGIDCRYCHSGVERSAVAGVPPTQTCMGCHKLILPDSPKLAPIRKSFETGVPMEWVRIHKSPDFVYFNHSMHLRAGVGCESCHGNIAQMEVVTQNKPLNMAWCLDCHRSPDMNLRTQDKVTEMGWIPPENQAEIAAEIIHTKGLKPSDNCSTCHR